MAIYSPTGVVLTLNEAPDLAAGVTIMGWWRPSPVVVGYQLFFEIFNTVAWTNALWCGLDLNSMNFALELWNDPDDAYDVATEVAIAGAMFHLAIVVDPGGQTATLYVTDESHSMDVLAVATVTNLNFAPADLAVCDLALHADSSRSVHKVIPRSLTQAEIRVERDRWDAQEDAWALWPLDRRAYFQAQTHLQEVSGNNRHLLNLTSQGLGADVADPAILQYTANGSCRKVIGAVASAAAAVTTVNVAVPAGASTSGNDIVRVNDALVLMLVHGGAGWATVPAAWTLVQRGVQGACRLEVYIKNYGMVDNVPTAEVTPVVITGVDGAIGRIVAYGGMEHASRLLLDSDVNTGVGVRPFSNEIDTGTDWQDALLEVAVMGMDTNTGGFLDSLHSLYGAFDLQADKDMDANNMAFLFESHFAGFALMAWEHSKISQGRTNGWQVVSTAALDDWVFVDLVLRPHDQRFARRHYYSYGRLGLTLERTTDFPSEQWDNLFYSPGAWAPWIVWHPLTHRKDRAGAATVTDWTSNVEIDAAWQHYAHPLEPMTSPNTTRLTINYARGCSENYLATSTAAVHIKLRVRVFLTTSRSDLSEATVLINEFVSAVDFPSTFGHAVETLELPAFTAPAACWLVVIVGIRFEDIPMPAVTYPSPTEWATAKMLLGGGHASEGAGENDGPDTGGSSSYTAWLEWSEHFLAPARPAPPANMTRATAIVIDPGDVPNYCSGLIDTRGATSPSSAIWFSFTPTQTRVYILHTFGSVGQAVIRVWNAAGTAMVYVPLFGAGPMQWDDDEVGGLGSVSWWRAELEAGTEYMIQVRRPTDAGTSSWPGEVQLWVEQVETPQGDDIFVAAGSGNTVMSWRAGRLVNIYSFQASAHLALGLAIDYTQRPMRPYYNYPADPEAVHTGIRLVVGLHDLGVPPGNDYAIVFDLAMTDPTSAGGGYTPVIDYLFWGTAGDPFGANTLEIDADGFLYVGSAGFFATVVGATRSYESALKIAPDSAILKWDLLQAWRQMEFDSTPPGAKMLLNVAYDVMGSNYIKLGPAGDRLLYTSSAFYIQVPGTKVKAVSINGAQLPDVVSPIAAGTGPDPGPRGLCTLPDGGFLLCNGAVVQRYNAAGAHTQTYTPTNPIAYALTDVDLTNDLTSFWCYDMAMSRFYKFNLASGTQTAYFPTFTYPGSSHSFVVFRPDRFAEVPEPSDECVLDVPSTSCWGDSTPSAQCSGAQPSGPSASSTWSATFSPDVQRVGLKDSE